MPTAFRITIIAGARPNFMKIAPIIHEIELNHGKNIQYRLVHTGQHYDEKMSRVFFDELNIPVPHTNLEVGGGTQGYQTAHIILRFEEELTQHPADVVVVVGDVTSTLACSIVAKKMNTQLVHVEGGIRSFDLAMPEEINRMVTDSLSDHFFTTSHFANENLTKLGVPQDRIHFTGNVMIDTLLKNAPRFHPDETWQQLGLQAKKYWLVTLHRPSNVDNPDKLAHLLDTIDANCGGLPVIFPVHPRTRQTIQTFDAGRWKNFHFVDPMGYLVFNHYMQHSLGVITDSGGIQEETTVMKVPCLTLRDSTERPETVVYGSNVLVKNVDDLPQHIQHILAGQWKDSSTPELWDGKAAGRIVAKLVEIYGH